MKNMFILIDQIHMLLSRPFWNWRVYFVVVILLSNLNHSMSPWLTTLAAKTNFLQLHHQQALQTNYSSHIAAWEIWSASVLFFVIYGDLEGAGVVNIFFWLFRAMMLSLPQLQNWLSMFTCCAQCPIPGWEGAIFQGVINSLILGRKPSKMALPSRRLFSLLQPKLIFSFSY